MKIYQVGGSIRDELLGRPIGDRDFVVVGSSPQEMRAKGYKQVGKSFPVFLHPKTKEEYALARFERKTGVGHKAFDFDVQPHISLEEDLSRRDLTINAIAKDKNGKLHDPFSGIQDLEARILRHVSEAFVEDPLRVLRVARFCAELADFGFRVAEETHALMRQVVESGELLSLSKERIYQETLRAMRGNHYSPFFETLHKIAADKEIFGWAFTLKASASGVASLDNPEQKLIFAVQDYLPQVWKNPRVREYLCPSKDASLSWNLAIHLDNFRLKDKPSRDDWSFFLGNASLERAVTGESFHQKKLLETYHSIFPIPYFQRFSDYYATRHKALKMASGDFSQVKERVLKDFVASLGVRGCGGTQFD